MLSIRIAMHAALFTLIACKEPSPLYPAGSPPEIVQACALMEQKCTGCHDRERYLVQRHTPERWEKIVHKMRLFPASAITPEDAEIILRCLNYRSSATSFDTHPRRPDGDERAPMYVAPRGEVQALHFDLHNSLHVDTENDASMACNHLK
jgi:hypothetical protein